MRHVEDELRVEPRDRFADDQIRGVAIQALMSDSEVPEDRIEVGVVDWWLTLNGEVKHQYESSAAFEGVSGVPGVGGITKRNQGHHRRHRRLIPAVGSGYGAQACLAQVPH